MAGLISKLQSAIALSLGLLVIGGATAFADPSGVTVTVNPNSETGAPGDLVTFSGTINNNTTEEVLLDNATFTLDSGPSGADLNSAVVFTNFDAPTSLDLLQEYSGPLFDLTIDPSALPGTYTADFDFLYFGQDSGALSESDPTFTINVQSPSSAPEPAPAATLVLGAVGIGLLALARRQKAVLATQRAK